MIRGVLCRERVRTWSHRRLTRVHARESLTSGEPTRPPSDSRGFHPHTPAIGAPLRAERTPPPASGAWGGALQLAAGRSCAETAFRDRPDSGVWGGAPQIRRVGGVGLRTPLLRDATRRDARRGLRQRLADVLAMLLQPLANVLE